MLSHFSSLRLPSGNSGLNVTLRNAACTSVQPLLAGHGSEYWELSIRQVICAFYLFIFFHFPPGYVTLLDSKTPQTPHDRFSWCLKSSPFLRLPSREGLRPYLFCVSFYLLYFVLPPFEDNWLLFWVPDILCQHSEFVLWN